MDQQINGELRRSRGYLAYKMERSVSISCYMLERVLKIIEEVRKKNQNTLEERYLGFCLLQFKRLLTPSII